MPVNRNNIKFYGHSSSKAVKIKEIEDFKINETQPIKILIHGWMDNKDSFWFEPTVNEYLKKGNVNVITVDWGKHARGFFTLAVKSVKNVGNHVGDFITELAEKYSLPFEQFHLIGHSLGAHISGFAGKRILALRGAKIGRITALDPAGPLFIGNCPDDRLCSGDANFVDVIHTDGGHLGYEKPIGHADFFPCGGKRPQNGCAKIGGGSHNRAPLYFAESINTTNFVAVNTSNYDEFDCGRYSDNQRAVMGENCQIGIKGDFYLHINKNTPYAKGAI
ncbi:phospholipase A1 member A-like isoform X2 [Onthophagus taurus]|uniref:phospholipase A1 member A-like isoform X2 n=1 Tax=Onthophagus taurus TaxID=166361 RepID=UPI000C2085B5|nr:phospholipase A1 member A-like [Onthophagus taurus]